MAKLNERYQWAIEMLCVFPNDQVLEIGCATGILAEQIAKRLAEGQILAIDKSEFVVRKAEKRCGEYIEERKASFLVIDFKSLEIDRLFDRIVTFNVNFFLKESVHESQQLFRFLKPGGSLYVFYQPPYEIDLKWVEPIRAFLGSGGFKIVDEQIRKMKPASSVCITATK